MTHDDAVFLARFLERGADYHERRGSTLELDDTTMRAMRDAGVLLELPADSRSPGRLTPATARRYAEQLRGRAA